MNVATALIAIAIPVTGILLFIGIVQGTRTPARRRSRWTGGSDGSTGWFAGGSDSGSHHGGHHGDSGGGSCGSSCGSSCGGGGGCGGGN